MRALRKISAGERKKGGGGGGRRKMGKDGEKDGGSILVSPMTKDTCLHPIFEISFGKFVSMNKLSVLQQCISKPLRTSADINE